MSKEPSVKPKFPASVRFLHFDDYLGRPNLLGGGSSGGGGDELDRAQARDMKTKKSQIRRLEMDAYMATKNAEIGEANKKLAIATGVQPATAIAPAAVHLDAAMLEALSKMPDDQLEKVVSSAMNIAMSQGGAAAGQNNMMYMWPIIANMVKQNPNVPQVDIMAMAMLGTSPFCLVLSRNFLCIYVKSLSYLHISYNFHICKWHNMRKFIFGMCLLLLISILGLTSSQMAPVNKASAAGALDHFVFSNIGTQIAGTAFQITITAADAQNSTVTSYVATNTLSVSTGTLSPTSTTSFTRGVWTGQVTLNRAATGVIISTTGSSKSGKSKTFTVSPGALARFTITGYPTSVTAGQSFGSNNVLVTAYDAYGNIKTDYRGSVYFNSTDAQSVLPYTSGSKYTFTSQDNGVHTFAGTGFTLRTTPSQTITVTDGSRSATSNSITVTGSLRTITVTSDPTGSGYIRVDGTAYATPATFSWTTGEVHTISANSPVIVTSNQSRYVYSSWSDSGSQSHTITVSPSSTSTFTANFRLQYYLSVSGGNGAGWYNSSTSASSTASYVLNQVSGQSRNNLYQRIVDGIPTSLPRANSSTSTQSFTMSTYHTITWSYYTQYYLTNNLLNGSLYSITASPTRDSWYDTGTSVNAALNNVWGILSNQSRSNLIRCFNGTVSRTVSRTGPGTTAFTIAMTTYRTVNDTSVRQYYLRVTGGGPASYKTASQTSDNWYDSGSSTTVSSTWIWNTVSNQSRVAISNWQLDGINRNPTRRNSGNLTIAVSMSTYHAVNFVSTMQYYLVVSGGNGVTFDTASPTSDNWYDSGTSTTISTNCVWNVVSGKSRTTISNWQLDTMNQTVLFSDGFENGTGFTVWTYADASGTGSTARVSLSPHSGTFDARFVSDAGGWSHCTKSLEPSPVIYARAYYKFSTLNLGSWDVLSLLRLSHGSYNNSVTAQILFHDGNYYWQLATSDGVNNYHDQSVSSNITTGVWHCIEIKRDVINGQEELWVDGVSKVSAAHNIVGNTDRLEAGITYCGNVLGSGNTCYVDDIVITGAYNALGGPKTLCPPGLGTLTTPSITMSTYHTVKLRSTSQFYLTVNSTYSVAGGMGWYDSGSTAHATLMNGTVYGGTGISYVFMSWAGDASGSGLNSTAITMNAAKTATANWKQQYTVVLTEGISASTSTIDSNSTVTGLTFNSTNRILSFTVSGALGTTGYANVTIAKSLIGDINGVMVYVDGVQTNFNFVSAGDSWLLQFTYRHSTHRVDVSLGSATSGAPQLYLSPLITEILMIGLILGAVLFAALALYLIWRSRKWTTIEQKRI